MTDLCRINVLACPRKTFMLNISVQNTHCQRISSAFPTIAASGTYSSEGLFWTSLLSVTLNVGAVKTLCYCSTAQTRMLEYTKVELYIWLSVALLFPLRFHCLHCWFKCRCQKCWSDPRL